jgi:phosphohistidine phosphatase
MKFLTLVRHAKSSWDNPDWSDLERPLNKRGIIDAPFMANIISGKTDRPDRIFSSPANRAISTAKEYAKAFGIKESEIKVDEGIYNFGKRHILNIVQYLDNDIKNVFFFGHNPDITSLSSYLSGEFFDNVPTCGTVALQYDIDNWKDLANDKGKMLFFEYPKLYSKKDRQNFFDNINS